MIISLTSIPPRFSQLQPVLASLVAQKVEAVWLWIPPEYERFAEWDGVLPDVPDGVTIRRAMHDYGPATKLIPTLGAVPHDIDILICDDDAIYAPGWAEGFGLAAAENPEAAIAASSFAAPRIAANATGEVVQGFAGVLLRGSMVRDREIDPQAKWVDDIWLSANLAVSGTRIVTRPDLRKFVRPYGAKTASLQDQTLNNQSRAEANRSALKRLSKRHKIWGS